VKGPNAHPFYKWAADVRPKDVPRWNFHKYLIGRDGYIAEVFPRDHRTLGYAAQNRDCPGACGLLTYRLPWELTCSTDKSSPGEKAVAVAAQLQLGYYDRGRKLARAWQKPGPRRGSA
jgi:hypothetical protein